ncbi:BSD domain containing protein [Trema orientale]|uniref:BSD domain containing protein n=1 Tax=Trema orientale TaxID=63057 RepID=A0A2P5BTR3_TREOI|nr:BSD domain containing protein [Trema orientale]
MSWLIKTLRSNDPQQSTSPPPSPAGVKEDLSVIGQTIGRQLRGVAAFLAPPPATTSAGADSSPESETESVALAGIRNDLAEIGGSFKSGLTLLSSNSNRAVSEISRFASSWLQFEDKAEKEDEEEEEEEEDDDDDDDGDGGDGVPGITDEVLQFVTEISKRPEFWTDFPLQLDHEFSMSDAQSEHASSIEQFIPDFAALRLRICCSMSQEDFWMIYFILLVPRLSEHDFALLSTSKIVEARDVLLQKLRSNRDAESENSEVLNASQEQSQVSETQGKDNPSLNAHEKFEVLDKANTQQPVDKEIVNSGDNAAAADFKFETEDDISFSDLEEDDSEISRRLSDSRRAQDVSSSSPNESNDWVQLSKSPEAQKKAGQSREKDSEGEESNDWLTVDDFD